MGNDHQYSFEVLEPQGLGKINENGPLLVDYALNNDLVIAVTFFNHKTVHKNIRISPDSSTRIRYNTDFSPPAGAGAF